MFDNDFSVYNFEDFGLSSHDFKPLPDDGILLPVCWIDDDGHFLCL